MEESSSIIIINFSWAFKSFTVKEKHIGTDIKLYTDRLTDRHPITVIKNKTMMGTYIEAMDKQHDRMIEIILIFKSEQ